jgi:hypothetical protein
MRDFGPDCWPSKFAVPSHTIHSHAIHSHTAVSLCFVVKPRRT